MFVNQSAFDGTVKEVEEILAAPYYCRDYAVCNSGVSGNDRRGDSALYRRKNSGRSIGVDGFSGRIYPIS